MSAPKMDSPKMDSPKMGSEEMGDSSAMMEEVVYRGYVVDQACAAAGKVMDGSEVLTMPGDHTQHCLVACQASGFGVMVQEGAGYRYIPFDAAGSDLVFRTVVQATSKAADIGVEARGTLKDGVLVLASAREIDLMM